MIRTRAALAALFLALATNSWAQQPADAEARLRALEERMGALAAENKTLRDEVERLKAQGAGTGAAAAAAAAPKPAGAETAAPAPAAGAGAAAKKDSALTASFHDGVKFKAEDGNFDVHFGGQLLAQSRFFIDDSRNNNSFFVREARLVADGTFFHDYEFKVQGDFGKGAAQLQDGYVGWKKLPWLGLRVGQFKQPFSLQQLTSGRFIDFVERSPMDLLVPGRDLGVQLGGKVLDGVVEYAVSAFNGNGKNNAADANDDKDVAARLVLRPFVTSEEAMLKGLRIGAAVTGGNEKQAFANFVALDSTTPFLVMNGGLFNRGEKTRWNVEGAWTCGPFKLQGEAIWMDVELERTVAGVTAKDSVLFESYYVEALWVVTGEDAVFDRRKPAKNFGGDGGPGQIELALRYGQFSVGDELFDQGFARADLSTQGLDNWTAGVNWWLNPYTRFTIDYFRNDFWDDLPVGGKLESDEHGFLTRVQIDF
ncbi:MAG: hypothetical protein HYZ53_19095 [Planctomycetes bacterium]|nr:hypothetical protein [Planctomycetota bacterium]